MTACGRGLLVDYGGVLTTSVADAFARFCRDEGLPDDVALRTFLQQHDAGEPSPVHQIEVGAITGEEFAAQLAAALSQAAGAPVDPRRLVDRLFAGLRPDEQMLAAVAAARAAGVRTGLLSNSWGAHRYPRARFSQLFDVLVISGELGVRKPDPEIYRIAARRLGLDPTACVFVDDLPSNIAAAEAVGMRGLHHVAAATTLPRLAELLGLPADALAA